MVIKFCPGCKVEAEFSDSKNIGYCKICWRAYGKRWREAHKERSYEYILEYRKKNPEKIKSITRKSWNKHKDKYNLDRKLGGPSLYEELFKEQDGVCAICKQPEQSKRYKTLCVDHNHDTEQIRGLLCSTCNRALGLFKDSKEVLNKAIQYLEKFE